MRWLKQAVTRIFYFFFCVMKDISFMAIARWVGHRDGGVLIGKVYGHLNAPFMSL